MLEVENNSYSDNAYLVSLKEGKIKTNREANKFDFVRKVSYKQFPTESQLLPTVLASIGFYYDPQMRRLKCSECPFTEINIINNTISQIVQIHSELSFNCKNIQKQLEFLSNEDQLESSLNPFKTESKRLDTFQDVKFDFNPKELAKNGLFIQKDFYALNPNLIKLKCAFCPYECTIFSQGLSNNYYENPLKDHAERNPQCPIITLRLYTNNETIKKNTSEVTSFAEHSSLIHYKEGDLKQLKNVLLKTLNAKCDKPFHSGYSTEQARMESFKEWPTHMTQKPLELAKAGFYYYGIKDMVKCFFCNGGLRNWDPTDEPLIEHARWFPKCPYIRQLKGPRFIEEVGEKYKDQDSGFGDDFDDMPEYYQSSGEKRPKRDVSPMTINSRLDLPSFRQLMDVGISKKATVRQAIEKKLASEDRDFDSLLELTKACMRMENNMVNLQKQLKSVVHVCISNLGDDVTDEIVKKFIQQNFGISIKDIKRFEEHTDDTRGLVMIQLNDEDLHRCDEIVERLNEKTFPGSSSVNELIAKSLIDSKFIQENSSRETAFSNFLQACFKITYDIMMSNNKIKLKSGNIRQSKIFFLRLFNMTNGSPINYAFISEEERFKSFVDGSIDETQNALELAKEGFFYDVNNQIVKCHYCNIELSQLMPSEVPIIEHAKSSQNCGFIKLLNGAFDKDKELKLDVRARLDFGTEYINTIGLNKKIVAIVIESKLAINEFYENYTDLVNDCIDFEVDFTTIEKLKEDFNHGVNLKNCIVCLNQSVNCLCFPCMHHTSCFECISSIQECPTCNQTLEAHIRFF